MTAYAKLLRIILGKNTFPKIKLLLTFIFERTHFNFERTYKNFFGATFFEKVVHTFLIFIFFKY